MVKILPKYISFSFALWTMIILNSLVIIFHLFVLTKVIPFDIVWAGKLKSEKEMFIFESISIGINLVLMLVLLIKGKFIKINKSEKIIRITLWVFAIVFALNTIGNLFSTTNLETYIATPLTFISSVLCLRLSLKKDYA